MTSFAPEIEALESLQRVEVRRLVRKDVLVGLHRRRVVDEVGLLDVADLLLELERLVPDPRRSPARTLEHLDLVRPRLLQLVQPDEGVEGHDAVALELGARAAGSSPRSRRRRPA